MNKPTVSGQCPNCGNPGPEGLVQYQPTLTAKAEGIVVIWECLHCDHKWQEFYSRPLYCNKFEVNEQINFRRSR